jgi:hypothetical protein
MSNHTPIYIVTNNPSLTLIYIKYIRRQDVLTPPKTLIPMMIIKHLVGMRVLHLHL